jgi:phosphoribosylanthranilate isomerase
VVEVKFCGLTREDDAAAAAALGAAYAGVIFAGGPRELSPECAALVHAAAGPAVLHVGVFGADFRTKVPDVIRHAPLDVIQLHADPSVSDIIEARAIFPGVVWAAVRVAGDVVPDSAAELFGAADAVVLDARVTGALGGTGVPIQWARIAGVIAGIRAGGRLVLAGGLSPGNVQEAVAALHPDIVDVSSGVESASGVKDHARMRAFFRAARGESA